MVISVIRRTMMTPVWLAQILTPSKSFKANPIIGSRLLNRMGLHVGRLLAAHAIMGLRYALQTPFLSAKDRKAFWRDGFILKHDFLPRAEFEALRDAVFRYEGVVRELIEGKTVTQRVLLTQDLQEQIPAFRRIARHLGLVRLMRYASATNSAPLFYVENLVRRGNKSETDPQTTFHSDTFHPTAKCWLFLHDVTADEGPFVYVPGSHRLTWARVKWEHRRSLTARDCRDGHSEHGSFRVQPHELPEMGYKRSPRTFTVSANTLVVASTFGFHARGTAASATSRQAVWGFSRTNPFSPFPGIDCALTRWVGDILRRLYFRSLDHRTRNGAVPNRRIYTGPLCLSSVPEGRRAGMKAGMKSGATCI